MLYKNNNMVKMLVKHKENPELNAVYYLETIVKVIHGKYKDFYSKSDIAGNCVRPNDSCLIIFFDDDSKATFGSDYEITFEFLKKEV